jgi:tetratricopeptide (TPR) repeat protein
MHSATPLVRLLPLLLLPLTATGCLRAIATDTVGDVVDHGFEAITAEGDLDFAAQALPGNLKLLEVLLANQPENETILILLSQGYSSYALGFVEDTDPVRARDFYLRGARYGERALKGHGELARAFGGSLDDLTAALDAADADAVPAVFWTAFGWGGLINISLTDPDALVMLPRAEAMMRWVAQTDSSFYYAGAHLFLGALAGGRPRMLGGDPEKSRAHFETALRINGGKFLLTQVYYARSYAVQMMDEELFDRLLENVRTASPDILPEFRLANAIARKKAALLVERKSELF